MRHKIETLQAGLRLIYEWLFSVLFFYFIVVVFVKKKPDGFVELALLIIFIISYIIRKKARFNLWILLVHALLAVGVYFIPFENSTKWILLGLIIYQMGESFLYEKKGVYGNFRDAPWLTFIISIIFYAYGYATKSSLLKTSSYIIPVLLIIVYLIMLYIDGLRGYVDSSKDVSGLPINRIITVNSSVVLIIVVLLIAGIGLGGILGFDQALYKALKAILYFIVYIILFIRLVLILLSAPFLRTPNERLINEQSGFRDYVSEHADDFAGFFDIMYKICAAILIIYILYKVVSWSIRLILKKRIIIGDLVEDAVTDKKIISTKRVRKDKFSMFSTEQRFRKSYRERILMYRYDIRLESNKTSNDIKDELYKNELDDITDITEAYNEIRYGNQKATKEMLRLFDK
ncbi:MAG: hypothetical protein IJ167_02045 [Lachnospiraceae bacterium]|nr:hypothetical protein [Lachnospiraceae bacterium]